MWVGGGAASFSVQAIGDCYCAARQRGRKEEGQRERSGVVILQRQIRMAFVGGSLRLPSCGPRPLRTRDGLRRHGPCAPFRPARTHRRALTMQTVGESSSGAVATTEAAAPTSKSLAGAGSRVQTSQEVEIERELLELCGRAQPNGVFASEELRQQIQDCALRLEEEAGVVKAATEQVHLIDGEWRLLYTSQPGNSNGKVGPFVGNVIQSIDVENLQIRNQNFLGPLSFTLSATWQVLDDHGFKVMFEDVVIRAFNAFTLKRIPFRKGVSGIWRMGYTTANMRLIWTRSTEKGNSESLFILRKQETPNFNG